MKIIYKLREPMNGFTHFIGVIFSIAALILLIDVSNDSAHLFSLTIFGLGLILLYTTSTLYHWLNLSDRGVQKLRKADHIMIFINIAATYTPVCVLALRGTAGRVLLVAVWTVALIGIILKLFWMNAPRWLSTIIYLAMGWLAVIVIVPLFNVLQFGALIWLFAGGLFFTVGAIVYARKKPNPFPGILGFHEIFHLFVFFGSLSHFIMIYFYIVEFR
jgi:hemolysin III